jgi:6-phosphofructokinase 2
MRTRASWCAAVACRPACRTIFTVASWKRRSGPAGKSSFDSSGAPLKSALAAGVYLVKPSLSELRDLLGAALDTRADQIKACRVLIEKKQAEVVALTLGEQGAILVTHDHVLRARALPIEPKSVVGAGDSFLGAMIWALASGHAVDEAFRYGVAAGSAALLVPGTELCQRDDIERLVKHVELDVLSSR